MSQREESNCVSRQKKRNIGLREENNSKRILEVTSK